MSREGGCCDKESHEYPGGSRRDIVEGRGMMYWERVGRMGVGGCWQLL